MAHYELIVIGAGPGGYEAALQWQPHSGSGHSAYG